MNSSLLFGGLRVRSVCVRKEVSRCSKDTVGRHKIGETVRRDKVVRQLEDRERHAVLERPNSCCLQRSIVAIRSPVVRWRQLSDRMQPNRISRRSASPIQQAPSWPTNDLSGIDLNARQQESLRSRWITTTSANCLFRIF